MGVTLADAIERHIAALLQQQEEVELQRAELARLYDCAPSQVTYVLSTRFTPQRGFVIESRRGGGGYIRVRRAVSPGAARIGAQLRAEGASVTQDEALMLIAQLCLAGELAEREANMLRAIVAREVLRLPLPLRDEIRSQILGAALWAVAGG